MNDHEASSQQYGDARCSVEVTYDGRTALVRVTGEADQLTAPTLAAGIGKATSYDQPRAVIDLLGVSFLASAAIRELIVGHRALGERLAIVARDRVTMRPLVELALDRLFPIFDTVAEATA